MNSTPLLADYANQTENEELSDRLSGSDFGRDTYHIVSLVAYLIGVPARIFENEFEPPKLDIYEELEENKAARIIRRLCQLRTKIERNYLTIRDLIYFQTKNLDTIPEQIPPEWIRQLESDGVNLIKANCQLNPYIVRINRLISDHINNCKTLFPLWVNWDYIKDLFIMQGGFNEATLKEPADVYMKNIRCYPYQMYINWVPEERGNIILHDRKFMTILYEQHGTKFTDWSKVSDAGKQTKNGIYDFLENSSKVVVVVDCENSDPYKLCATLQNLERDMLAKISKIILYDDIHTVSAWRVLNSYVKIPIEHVEIERVKASKSLVDVRLVVGVCEEHRQNQVDSFILVSSDSDYWGLISALPSAKFLVMVESAKCGPDIKRALNEANIFYCYLDDFYTGNSDAIRVSALLKELHQELDRLFCPNMKTMLERALYNTRIEMSMEEKRRFYDKYIKTMHIILEKDGNVSIGLGSNY